MTSNNQSLAKTIETDVLILGSGAAGCGAAISAREKGVRVLLVDKQKLESSGCAGGGNDHFMAVLNSGAEMDTTQALVDFYKAPIGGLTPKLIEDGWGKAMPVLAQMLEDNGLIFLKNPDGSWLRTVGFGQPGAWWINIENGYMIKRLLAKKVRSMGADVLDHTMITWILVSDGRAAGAVGYNVLDGSFCVIRAKKIILAMGNVATRGWTNSTGNPYNVWFQPYNTGGQFVLGYEAGVKILNLDIMQTATLLPKGYGAPGMNGINSMGGKELNALGERFMGKYDPMWENGKRVNQISGTYQELIEGNGPPFYEDMTHFSPEDVKHLQYVLMPGDKATYNDYTEQRGIDFGKEPLEVEISELAFGGLLKTGDDFQTNVPGIYNGCAFFAFSGAMCGGYSAGGHAAEACLKSGGFAPIDEAVVIGEKKKIFQSMKVEDGISYKEFEGAIRQVLMYYMGYRRNQKGMEVALDRLKFIEESLPRIASRDYHELMRTNESYELIKIAQLTAIASMERKESGRAYYRRTDHKELNPELGKPLAVWQENGEMKMSWGV